jgi:hypothetical protein
VVRDVPAAGRQTLSGLLATVPVTTYIPLWAATTITIIGTGIGATIL